MVERDGHGRRSAHLDAAVGDDEDGITFASPAIPGETLTIVVEVRDADGGAAYLDGWIDWNGDGSWLGAGEHVMVSRPVSAGAISVDLPVPQDAALGETFARFRLSRQQGA